MEASVYQYILNFKQPSGTSRGILTQKETWFVYLQEDRKWGLGECGILRGLSVDDRPDYEQKLRWATEHIHLGMDRLYSELTAFPSIQFGLEMAFQSLEANDPFQLFPSRFSEGQEGIPINGLIWMGDKDFMKSQIRKRLQDGFSCLKMKIGAIDFESEMSLLKSIRKEFSEDEIELRVDANGAFSPAEALEKLKRLSDFKLHSIEQPIPTRKWQEMARLCETTPLPIALDEELIGVFEYEQKRELLKTINPQYIILKPSFIGGFQGSDEWIELAKSQRIGWWVTSALESNVGLNAISQYTFPKNSKLPQGLGTGSLYTNNFPSPLKVAKGKINYDPQMSWDLTNLNLN